jgi:signal transduction histidine kinase
MSLKRFFFKLVETASKRVEKYGARYTAFGAFSLINYILPFYMWSDRHSVDVQVLAIRVIAGMLNFLLILHKSWDKQFIKYLPLFWYFTVMFSLPFFASYMLFLEGFSVFWVINISLALILSLIILDFYSFLVVFSVGVALAYLLLRLLGYAIKIESVDYFSFQAIYLLIFSGVIAIVFSRNREKIEQEKMRALRAFGGTIAHEMRTPLSTISMICKTTSNELSNKNTNKEKIKLNVEKISGEVKEMLLIVEMILTRLRKPGQVDFLETFSVKEVVTKMLDRYPFADIDRKLVTFKCNEDFLILGNKNSLTHILFNLLQNALYQIHSVNKGRITITTESYDKERGNILSFRDTASGMAPNVYSKVFEPMVTWKSAGTGLGLYFCKSAMMAMGGELYCESKQGQYTEFFLVFPKVNSDEKK